MSSYTNVNLKTLPEKIKREYIHFDGPGKYYKIQNHIRTRETDNVPSYKMGYLSTEFQKAKKSLVLRDSKKLEWIERGPTNTGGRTRGIAVDPSDNTHHTFYSGTVGGGIWKTEDGAKTWTNLTPELPNLAISTLAISTHNTDIVYAGTGEGFGSLMVNGSGMWKTEDKGKTWNLLVSTSKNKKFQNILRIIVNPDDENELLVCTVSSPRDRGYNQFKSYILKSKDGGETWEEKYSTLYSPIQQLVYTPGNFSIMYASSNNNGILKSTDSGETWEKVFDSESKNIDRIEMSVSPKNAGIVFLSCEYGEGSKLYITRDTFKTVDEVLFEGTVDANWLRGQGWYDNTIAAHPFDENKVWVGGSSAILELNVSNTEKEIKTLLDFKNKTSFLVDVKNDNIPLAPDGVASDFLGQLLLNPETTEDDFIDIEIRFGKGKSQKAHLLKLDLTYYDITYNDFIDVPFEAWDTVNNRQVVISVLDLDDDGIWTFNDYNDISDTIPDMVIINNIDYNEEKDNMISNVNPVFKALYYFIKGKRHEFEGSVDSLPNETLFFDAGIKKGVAAEFSPITDGYYQFYNVSPVGSKGVHVDHHNLILLPIDEASNKFYVYNANDGGIAFSDNSGNTFRQTGDTFDNNVAETSDGYNVSQFYGVDKMNGGNRYIGGTQDNGTWISPNDPDENTKWEAAPSGDGFEAAWNYGNTDLILESSQYNNIFKSTDGGQNWNKVFLPESSGPFVTRIATSQIDPDLVFVGSDKGLIKSMDFGETWDIKTMPESWIFSFFGPPTKISLSDANIVWSGSGISEYSRVALSRDKGETWEETARYPKAEMGRLTGIATHPSNPNTAYVMFSQANGPKILKTANFGKSWEDISGFETNEDESTNGFPDIATYSLLVMPFDTNVIWAGTELGIFESLNGGKTWSYADNGIPAVGIWQMKIVNDEIVVATHGRGIWTLNTSELVGTINAVSESIDFNIYPNPVVVNSTIRFKTIKKELVNLSIYSLDGKKIKTVLNQQVLGEKEVIFNRKGLNSGIYILSLKTKEGISSKKIVIQ